MTRSPRVCLVIGDSHHTSYLTSLVACLQPLGARISALLMTDADDAVARFRPEGVEQFFTTPQDRPDFATIWPHMRGADLVILDEPFTFKLMLAYLGFGLRLRAPVVLSIHNLHTWFFPRVRARPKALVKMLLRKALTLRFKHYLVIGSNILDYARKRLPGRDFLYVPFGIPEGGCPAEANTPRTGDRLRVVIPGSVNRRRDYDWLVESLERDTRLRDKVEITLLGRPLDDYGLAILERCARLREQGWALTTFPKFVPREEYGRLLCAADVLLSVFDTRYVTADGQEEIYGRSKETGVSYLAWAHAKPLIAPASFVPLHEIEGQVLAYADQTEIFSILERIEKKRNELASLQDAARKNLSQFSLAESTRRIRGLLKPSGR